MTNNTNPELPAEILKEIEALVMEKTLPLPNNNDFDNGYEKGMERGIEIGATSYATKMLAAEQENGLLKDAVRVLDFDSKQLKGAREGYKTACDDLTKELSKVEVDQVIAKALLNEVFRKHEAGLLPDRFIYEKIKTFLYGE